MGKQIEEILDEALDTLTEEELRVVYQRVGQRLEYLDQMKRLEAMKQFLPGDQVAFRHGGRIIAGKIIRYNRKTITVHTEDHQDWNVSPKLLIKLAGE